MGSIARIAQTLFRRFGRAPGKSIGAKTKAAYGQTREIAYWQLPGVAAAPTEGDRAIEIRVGGGRVIIASKNYRVAIEPKAGEHIIYSLNAAGDTEMSRTHHKQDGTVETRNDNGHVTLKSDGNIDLNGDGRTLVTHAELASALESFATSIQAEITSAITSHTHGGVTTGSQATATGTGTASKPSIDISTAEAQTVRTKL
jgi:hypothetical protein